MLTCYTGSYKIKRNKTNNSDDDDCNIDDQKRCYSKGGPGKRARTSAYVSIGLYVGLSVYTGMEYIRVRILCTIVYRCTQTHTRKHLQRLAHVDRLFTKEKETTDDL